MQKPKETLKCLYLMMIKNLQVLRALAALLVAYYHFGFNNSKIGFFGVDIFFVISGFIMSYVLFKNQNHFFLKRMIKIVPMYYIITVLISILWFIRPHLFNNVFVDGLSLIKSLFFIPYLRYNSGPILSSGWTLNYEIYFYLTLSSFLIFTKNVKKVLILTGLWFTLIYILQQSNYFTNYYLSIYGNPIVFEFILGIGLYWLYKHHSKQLLGKSLLLLAFVSICCFFMMIYFNLNHIEGPRLLLYGLPSFLITTFFVISENSISNNSFIYKWLYKLGNASYVIYLIHPFIMNFFVRLIHPLLQISSMFISFLELSVSMLLLCIISDFVHVKIEKPLLSKIERKLL